MRNLGGCVVLLGLAALGLIASDTIWDFFRGPVPAPETAGQDGDVTVRRVIAWTAFAGIAALVTAVLGIGDLLMPLRDRKASGTAEDADRETAAMIDAEVNEGGRPSPSPSDTPAEHAACQEVHAVMNEHTPMIETCPAPDRILHLPLGDGVGAATSATLLRSTGLELIRLVIPAGKQIPPHRAPGEITVQCIEGHVAFEHDGHTIELRTGDLLYVCPQELHALKGLANSSVLVTRLRLRAEELPETFPAR